MNKIQKAVMHWMATGETGCSSKTMALWLAFGERYRDSYHPLDPGDVDRCLGLLEAVPGLRADLPKMALISKNWAALMARWDEVETSHLAEVGLHWSKGRIAPRTYQLMKDIARSVK